MLKLCKYLNFSKIVTNSKSELIKHLNTFYLKKKL